MTEFVTRSCPVGNGSTHYEIIVSTDNEKHYKYVQKAVRDCIDESNAERKGHIRYKDFEIRESIGVNAKHSKYEIVKWSTERLPSTGKPWCWVIAFIRWNAKEPCWQLDVVGTRFVDDYEDGLSEFIREFLRDRRPEEEGAE